jgi:hypothetical protein
LDVVTDKDVFFIYFLLQDEEDEINVVDLVYNHMIYALIDTTIAIPYGFLITKFFGDQTEEPFLAGNAFKSTESQ